MLCDMPLLILFLIFTFVDLETLILFKRVNKFYYNLITSLLKDPHFISERFKDFSKESGVLCDPARGFLVSENGNLQVMIEMPITMTSTCLQCNGVMCISDKNMMETYLVNPAIKEFHRLPQPEMHANILVGGMELGYDSGGRDFKVIRIGTGADQITVAEIYSLSTDAWRHIAAPVLLKRYYKVLKSVYCDDVFYWSFYGMKSTFILCFNMYDEEFYTLPLPRNFYNEDKAWTIAVFNGSLALITYPLFAVYDLVIEVWVVDSFSTNVGVCWKKIVSVGPLEPCMQGTPLDFWNNDELLIHHPGGYASSYNIRTQKTKRIKRVGENLGNGVMISDKAFGYKPKHLSVRPRIP